MLRIAVPPVAVHPPAPPRWQACLYVMLTLLLLVPLWVTSRLPTVDGPCHLYNAWVMHHLHDPAYPAIGRHFRLDFEPVPNWLIQASLYGLLFVVAPATAEKLLLTAYVLLFGAAAWYLAGSHRPQRASNALLALPFAFTWMLQMGFYNFCFGVALAMLAVGWWWRHRASAGWRPVLLANLLLLLCYFAHIVALVEALLAMGILWLASWEREGWRRRLTQPLHLLPQVVLPLWFVATHGATPLPNDWSLGYSWIFFWRQGALFPYRFLGRPGKYLSLLFAGLVISTLVRSWRRRGSAREGSMLTAHAFGLAAAAALALYFVGPGGMAGGGVIQPRLALFPFLLLLPWLEPTGEVAVPGRSTLRRAVAAWPAAAIALSMTLLVGWETLQLARWERHLARGVDAFLTGLEPVQPHSRVLALVEGRYKTKEREALGHAVGHLAMAKGLVDWDDYQAFTDLFPVRLRPGLPHPLGVELTPNDYDAVRFAASVDYVYTWGLQPGAALRARLRARYWLVASDGEGQLWQRRPRWNLPGLQPAAAAHRL